MIYGLRFEGELRYIGQTVADPADRLSSHRHAARKGDDSAVYRWMRSVGPELVTIDVLATAPAGAELTELEQQMIALAVKHGVNLTNSQFHPLAPALGRTRQGVEHPRSKLTDEVVVECRRLYQARMATCGELARRHGVTRTTMHGAIVGRTYSYLPPMGERAAFRPCRVPGCTSEAPPKYGGVCVKHLARMNRNGSYDDPGSRLVRTSDDECVKGHPLTEDNRKYGRVRKDGTRTYSCRACFNDWRRTARAAA